MSDTGLDIGTLVVSSLTLLIILMAVWWWSLRGVSRSASREIEPSRGNSRSSR